jgi:hypothetical protein
VHFGYGNGGRSRQQSATLEHLPVAFSRRCVRGARPGRGGRRYRQIGRGKRTLAQRGRAGDSRRNRSDRPITTLDQGARPVQEPCHIHAMHDVELALCTQPVAHELVPLLDRLVEFDVPRAERELLVASFRSLVAAELAGAFARWTPHYDLALRRLADATDEDLLDPVFDYTPEPIDPPSEGLPDVRRQLGVHARLSAQLAAAEAAGARTLAAAFDHRTIGSDELETWFALCPDPGALDRRLRDAALGYLRETRAESQSPELEAELIDAVQRGLARADIHRMLVQPRARARATLRDRHPDRRGDCDRAQLPGRATGTDGAVG